MFKRGISCRSAPASSYVLAEPSMLSSAFGLRFPRWTTSASPARWRIALAGCPTSTTSFRQPFKLILSNPLLRFPPGTAKNRKERRFGASRPLHNAKRFPRPNRKSENKEMCYYINSLGVAPRPTPAEYLCRILLSLNNVLGKTLNLEHTCKWSKLLIANKSPTISICIRFLTENNHQRHEFCNVSNH